MSADFDDATPERPTSPEAVPYAIRDIYRRLKGGNAKFAFLTKMLVLVGTFALGSLGSAITLAYRAGSFVEQAGESRERQREQAVQVDQLEGRLRDQTEALRLLTREVEVQAQAIGRVERRLEPKRKAVLP